MALSTLIVSRALRAAACGALLLAVPPGARALTQPSLRDLADPVPPGGVLTYRVTLSDASQGTTPFCFNPPPECVTIPVTCSNPPPSCAGDASTGFACQNSANDGTNCGVGTPPAADPSLCAPRSAGTCNGGNNDGLACTAPDGTITTQCPGSTFVCERAYNQGDYCGSGDPPQAEQSFCLARPNGICSGGPNFGLPCTAPHGAQTAECPQDPNVPPPTNVTVELPILSGLTFIDADNGGTSDGTKVTWTVPPLGACGVPETPACPRVEARLQVDPLVPEGTVFANQATATDQDGFLVSGTHRTTVARFRVRSLVLVYPPAAGRDKVVYRSLFTLLPTESIDPANEAFELSIADANGTLADLTLAAGQIAQSSGSSFTFAGSGAGIRRLVLRNISPGFYSVRLRAVGLDMPDPASPPDVTVTLTLGDDTLSHPATLESRQGGRRFVAQRSTTTTTIVSPPTTTTTMP